ncbi:hypothetical protein DSECCO2_641530 [anaerobic digester metagenome]
MLVRSSRTGSIPSGITDVQFRCKAGDDMDAGWVKLYRELMDRPIWLTSTKEQKVILITLLMMANHKANDWEWQGNKFTVQPGQFVTSLDSIKNACGSDISVQNIRTALARFEKLEFLTNKSTKSGRLITIVNWAFYQGEEKNQQSNQQRPNKDLTPNKNDKNDKNNIYTQVIDYLNQKTGTNFRPTAKETQRLINARLNESFTVDDFIKVIDTKSVEWKGTEFEKYLRPATLFGPKFENYLNAKPIQQPEQQRRVQRILNQE